MKHYTSKEPRKRSPILFGVRFLLVFFTLMGSFEATRGTAFEHFIIDDSILQPTVVIINLISPHTPAHLDGRKIVDVNSSLRVTRGCEGIETILLLTAAILAYPIKMRSRLRGLAYGIPLAYALSVVRLLLLHFILSQRPELWEALHGLVLPLLPIVAVGLFFSLWISAQQQRPDPTAGGLSAS
jgi:exosortase/archaeosortase family protein